MKKVLIWDTSFKLANVGGPAGYLYNIHEYLKQHPNPQMTFLSDVLCDSFDTRSHNMTNPSKSVRSKLLSNKFIARTNDIIFTIYKEHYVCNISLPSHFNLNDYDYVHFHQTNDVLRYAQLLKGTHCKTILTTHCPCPRTEEILSIKPNWYHIFASLMRKQERKCYSAADYLMFPCQGAREPYEKDNAIHRLFQTMENKFFYCPSAILDIPIDEDKMQRFSQLGIPDGSFVITYFGRHNEIKGYDILKKIGETLLNKYPNLYFVCAGKGPIEPPSHPHWIELGFIKNTHELLWQSDLYILPNRETYFDLVVLEILRSKTPLLLAENGGNLYFKSLPNSETEGLIYFDPLNTTSLIQKVETLINAKKNDAIKYLNIGECNRQLWEKHFIFPEYIKRYIKEINSL